MRKLYLLTGLLILVASTGCQDSVVGVDKSAGLSAEVAPSAQAVSKNGAQLGGTIWADGELFGTVGTPTSLPPHGPFDKLYQGNFKDGVGAISESKPGDKDWNGGRWDVYVLKMGVTTDYSNADKVEDLNLNDFEPAGVSLR